MEAVTIKAKQIMVADDIDDGSGGLMVTCGVQKTVVVVDDTDSGGGGNDNGGTVTCEEEIKEVILNIDGDAMKLTDVKVQLDNDIDGGGGGSFSSSSSTILPKPKKGLSRTSPAPLLEKAFQMVEDPETDPIISWSVAGNSFIVWDSLEFSNNLIPRYFKHNNFSSFIRQLNLYVVAPILWNGPIEDDGFIPSILSKLEKAGVVQFPQDNQTGPKGFKKIDSDRWEFANEGFQRGKKHLLKNIKRRDGARSMHQKGASTCINETDKFRLESQLETLKNNQDVLKEEILKIRQQEETSQNHLTALEDYLQCMECKQNQMIIFLAKSVKNPTFVLQLIQQEKLKTEQNGCKIGKKRKLVASQSNESLLEAMDAINQVQEEQVTIQCKFAKSWPEAAETSQSTVDCRNQVMEEMATIQSEIQTMFYAAMDDEESGSSIQNKKAKAIFETSNPNLCAANDMKWQKLLEEVLMGENEAEEALAGNIQNFFLNLRI